MALVSYGASDDSDISEEEEEVEKEKVPISAGKTTAFQPNGHISDEEDDFLGGGIYQSNTLQFNLLLLKLFFEWISGEEDEFIPEKEEPDVFSLIAKKLPQVPLAWSKNKVQIDIISDTKYILNTYQALKVKKVEVLEETGPIPEKKDYGDKVVAQSEFKIVWMWPCLGWGASSKKGQKKWAGEDHHSFSVNIPRRGGCWWVCSLCKKLNGKWREIKY